MKPIRDKIWYFLLDCKVNQYIAEYSVQLYQKWDLGLNIFLLITTSSSIAAWAIWKQYPLLWALIIGVSQILTVTKPLFLFPKYVKIFNEKSIYWHQLSLDLEQLWHNVNYNLTSDSEASEKYFEFKNKSLNFNKFPDEVIFFSWKKSQIIAEEKCNLYIDKI